VGVQAIKLPIHWLLLYRPAKEIATEEDYYLAGNRWGKATGFRNYMPSDGHPMAIGVSYCFPELLNNKNALDQNQLAKMCKR